MLIQEEHEQARKLASSLRGGKSPHGGDDFDKMASMELGPASVRSLRERVVATVEEHDDAVYMRVRHGILLYASNRTFPAAASVLRALDMGTLC